MTIFTTELPIKLDKNVILENCFCLFFFSCLLSSSKEREKLVEGKKITLFFTRLLL